MATPESIQRTLESVPSKFRGPGGAVAVVKDGELAGKHVWGYANLDVGVPMTPTTIFPICSISKQMVCLVLTDLLQNDKDKAFEDALTKALHELLPHDVVANKELTVERLVAMQSGLRDYWALTVLWGAKPSGRFSIYQDAPKALQRVGGFHFPPGTQMSYCNTNFMSLGLAIEKATGQTLEDLLESRLFGRAGMTTAALRPDTERLPPPLVGYEGSDETGYIAYQNRIEWAGDAGIQASLEDMIAYEKYIDRSSSNAESAYRKNAEEPHYLDGSAANYGYGLARIEADGTTVVGHGGALAGFRLHRWYVADKRVSVLALLNSDMDSSEVAGHILRSIIGKPAKDQKKDSPNETKVEWTGHYLDEEANLAIAVSHGAPGELVVYYAGHDEKVKIISSSQANSKGMQVSYEDSKLSIHRLREGRQFTARPLAPPEPPGAGNGALYAGSYHSEEVDSIFHCTGTGDMLYGSFSGYLGQGPTHLMRHLGEDVWYLACHRSLDAPAPGNWTVVFHRGEDGKTLRGATVGCWLARNVPFVKMSESVIPL
ncbi:hypothetical protein B0A55_10728 [Friedmanniomyces simplex]|uniref:Beta-lactamase-related domain-containing protein n=1 Tax=Friedmanniomyces simplex TaxID=329884 RepID=A0A4U0WMS6_9PEZI|nr:hypothetical protein B0A55_10728 [Friedmanniomyces simplex]